MSRDLTAQFISFLEANIKTVAMFYEGQFTSGPLRLWTGVGDITWNSETWTGAGGLATVSQVKETTEVMAEGITCTLNAIPVDYLSLVLQEVQQGAAGKIWIGFIDDDGSVVADPALSFSGRLDVPTISDDAKTLQISLTYESKLRDLERPREYRYTSGSQDLLFEGDKFFDYVPSLQEWNGVWGS